MMMQTPVKILLIEDNPADARLVQEFLMVAGTGKFQFEHADRLSTGLKLLSVNGFDAVLLDLNLPDSQGLDTLKQLCARVPDMPILVLTGLQNEQIGLQAVKEGAQDFLLKGQVNESLITRSISYAMERKRTEALLRESERRLKEVQALGRIGYWEYDTAKQTIIWSDQTFVLYERDLVLGAPTLEEEAAYYSPEQNRILREYASKAIETGQNFKYDLQVKLPSGKMKYFSATMQPIKGSNGQTINLVGTVQDITERKRAEINLNKVNRSMKILSECNNCLVRATDEKDFFNDVCQIIRKNGEYSMVWIGLLKAEENSILLPVAYAGSEPYDYASEKINLTAPNGRYKILRDVFSSGKFQICNKLPDDRQPCFGPPPLVNQPCRSIISLPLFSSNQTIGALTIYSTIADIFDENEKKLLLELADDLSYGIAALRTSVKHKQAEEQVKINLKKIENTLEGTVHALAATSEMRDPYTAGHQRRVTQLACAIAQDMGFSQDRINAIRVAGLLHDIGKITVPAEILTKPSKLTDVEFAIIKTHPKAAYDVIKSIDFPWPISQYILQHHEKLNGSGYPSGLKSDEILMESRILCVADIVEAMSSHRPYRPALGIDVALEDMLANKGILYDPVVVDSCVKLYREKGFKFE